MWTFAFDIIKVKSRISLLHQKSIYSSIQIEKAYGNLSPVQLLNVFQVFCGTEKFDDIISQEFSGSNIDFSYHQLVPYQIVSLGLLLLSDALKNVSELHLSGCHIEDRAAEIFLHWTQAIECAGSLP